MWGCPGATEGVCGQEVVTEVLDEGSCCGVPVGAVHFDDVTNREGSGGDLFGIGHSSALKQAGQPLIRGGLDAPPTDNADGSEGVGSGSCQTV